MQHHLRNTLRLSHRRARSLSCVHNHCPQSIPFDSSSTRNLSISSTRPTVGKFTTPALSEDKDGHFARMLLFGKPGAGKGTLTARLLQKYDIVVLSTGDLLRWHISERTQVGKEAEAIIARGELVPDEVVLKVVTSKLDSLQNKHWILDGFPRTLRQGELLDQHLQKSNQNLTLVVNIDVPDDIILNRISERWIHIPSGRVYNSSYNRPRVNGFDDQTGEPLTRRPDDNLEVFTRRLESFYSTTAPLLDYYSNVVSLTRAANPSHQHPHQVSFHRPSGLKVKTLTGKTSDDIWPQLDRLLLNSFPGLRERQEPRLKTIRLDGRTSTLRTRTTIAAKI